MLQIFSTYKIINKTKNKAYFGRSKNAEERIKNHLRMLKGNRHFCKELQQDFISGHDICFVVIEHFATLEESIKAEQELLDKFVGSEYCYNISENARTGVVTGKKHRYYKQKPSEWMSEEGYIRFRKSRIRPGKLNPFYHKEHSKETREVLAKKCKLFGERNGFYGEKTFR